MDPNKTHVNSFRELASSSKQTIYEFQEENLFPIAKHHRSNGHRSFLYRNFPDDLRNRYGVPEGSQGTVSHRYGSRQIDNSGSLPRHSNFASAASHSSSEVGQIFEWTADVWKDTQSSFLSLFMIANKYNGLSREEYGTMASVYAHCCKTHHYIDRIMHKWMGFSPSGVLPTTGNDGHGCSHWSHLLLHPRLFPRERWTRHTVPLYSSRLLVVRDFLIAYSWHKLNRTVHRNSTSNQSITVFRCIVTMTTVGYGDLTPTTVRKSSLCPVYRTPTVISFSGEASRHGSHCVRSSRAGASDYHHREWMSTLLCSYRLRVNPPRLTRLLIFGVHNKRALDVQAQVAFTVSGKHRQKQRRHLKVR